MYKLQIRYAAHLSETVAAKVEIDFQVSHSRGPPKFSCRILQLFDFDHCIGFEFQLPVVFIDSHHETKEGKEAISDLFAFYFSSGQSLSLSQVREFSRETSTLWRILQNSRPWESVTKVEVIQNIALKLHVIFQPQLESAILDVKKKFGELHEK